MDLKMSKWELEQANYIKIINKKAIKKEFKKIKMNKIKKNLSVLVE